MNTETTFPLRYYIALDFDGTVVTHEYPAIGRDIGAIPVLKKLIEKYDAHIILNTMRSGKELEAAVEYLNDSGNELYGVNENPSQKEWTDSPKVYAHIYIDDAALGAPLKRDDKTTRPYIDWEAVENELLGNYQQTK